MFFAVLTKPGIKDKKRVVCDLIESLESQKHQVHIDKVTSEFFTDKTETVDFQKNYDLIIVIGGDGTLLRTVQFMKNFISPVLSINMGRLGFFSEGSGNEALSIVQHYLDGDFHVDKRMLARCSVYRNEKRVFSQKALNEVTIARDALARMIPLKTTVDDLKLTTFMADGMIIATPTGSTGYSLSAGGPVVSPKLDSFIITPISPHSFTQKPIVLPPSSHIKVSISDSQERTYLTMDGQTGFPLMDNDTVVVKRSKETLKLIRVSQKSYYKTLREKLHWGGDLSGR